MQHSIEFEPDPSQFSVADRLRRRIESSTTAAYRQRVVSDLKLFEIVAEVERTHYYRADGHESTAEWLANYLGIGFMRAYEFVDVALALQELPKMLDAFATGRLSYDHLRALVQVASEDTEADLLEAVEGLSVGDTFKLVDKIKKVSSEDSEVARHQRWVEMRWDKENRRLLLFAELPEEMGAKVAIAIDEIASDIPDDPLLGNGPTPKGVKRADALAQLAAGACGDERRRAMVVVHVDAEALAGGEGVAEIESGPLVSADTARKMACDSVMQVVTHDKDGRPMNAGRSRRTVLKRQKQQLMIRDGRCRYRGCRRTVLLVAHHMREWRKDFGPTDLENMVLFCETHHDVVHRRGYKVRGEPPNIWIERPRLPPLKPGPPRLGEPEKPSINNSS